MLEKWLIDVDQNLVTYDDCIIKLEPKAMLVLQFLAATPHEVVSRDEIFKVCWPNQVVTEDALNRVVSSLRKKFTEYDVDSTYITTIRNVGYKLIVPITEITNPRFKPQDEQSHEKEKNIITVQPHPMISSKTIYAVSLSVIFLLLVVLYFSFSLNDNDNDNHNNESYKAQRFSYNIGKNSMPAISNNNQWLTFIEKSTDHKNTLKLQKLSSNFAKSVGEKNTHYSHPELFLDGKKIAAISRNKINNAFSIVSIDVNADTHESLLPLTTQSHGLTIHPDDTLLVYTQPELTHSNNIDHQLFSFNMKTKKSRKVAFAPNGMSDRLPAFSLSGENIAFIRKKTRYQDAIFISDLRGNLQRLTSFNDEIFDVKWLGDEQLLITKSTGIYLVTTDKKISLWKKTVAQQPYSELSIWHEKNKVLVSKFNVLSTPLSFDMTTGQEGFQLTSAEALDTEANVSPDGKTLVFVSNRTNRNALWIRQKHQVSYIEKTESDNVYDIIWQPESNQFAAAYKSGKNYGVLLYDLTTKSLYKKTLGSSAIHLVGWKNSKEILLSQHQETSWVLNSVTLSENNVAEIKITPFKDNFDVYQGRLSTDKKNLVYLNSTKDKWYIWDFNSTPQQLPYQPYGINRNWYIDNNFIYLLHQPSWQMVDGKSRSITRMSRYNLSNGTTESLHKIASTLGNYRPYPLIYGFTSVSENKVSGDFWLLNLDKGT
jgi:DNA-binding winged helix-turn-helix (wHTH) protein/Tol biopolymer transport system component